MYPTHTCTKSTYAYRRETPSATPHAVAEQRRPVAFGSVVYPTPLHGSTIVHVLVCACTTTYTGGNPVCVWVEWNREGVPGRRDPGPKSWCALDFYVGVLPLRVNANGVCVVRVLLSVSLLLHVRRSRGRHRMGVPPLSDPLTAVGVEAPALTANVSHIPGLEPVLRRFRSVLSGRWTARKSVSLTTGNLASRATRIHCRKTDRSCSPTEVCPGELMNCNRQAASSVLIVPVKESLVLVRYRCWQLSWKDEVRKQVVLSKDFIEHTCIHGCDISFLKSYLLRTNILDNYWKIVPVVFLKTQIAEDLKNPQRRVCQQPWKDFLDNFIGSQIKKDCVYLFIAEETEKLQTCWEMRCECRV